LSRELHSWRTFGDLVMSGCSLVLHVIVLGQNRNGRFLSPWTRAYGHPAMPNNRWQWVKPEDTNWKPLQFIDQTRLDITEWLDQAFNQGAIQPLIQDQLVDLPAESVIRDTRYQIAREASDMMKLLDARTSYLSEPMSRGSCDLYTPCHYQSVCHSAEPVDLIQLGLNLPRKSAIVPAQTEVPVR
jgi:hypothetical protein